MCVFITIKSCTAELRLVSNWLVFSSRVFNIIHFQKKPRKLRICTTFETVFLHAAEQDLIIFFFVKHLNYLLLAACKACFIIKASVVKDLYFSGQLVFQVLNKMSDI